MTPVADRKLSTQRNRLQRPPAVPVLVASLCPPHWTSHLTHWTAGALRHRLACCHLCDRNQAQASSRIEADPGDPQSLATNHLRPTFYLHPGPLASSSYTQPASGVQHNPNRQPPPQHITARLVCDSHTAAARADRDSRFITPQRNTSTLHAVSSRRTASHLHHALCPTTFALALSRPHPHPLPNAPAPRRFRSAKFQHISGAHG